MAQLILFNKPYNVLSQFRTDTHSNQITLAQYITIKNVYPAGRLDKTSEGLLLLTDNGALQHKISHPDHKMKKTYWVQVEGSATTQTLTDLSNGVLLKDGITKKANAHFITAPDLPQRVPDIRYRANIPTSWISLTITEGRNRQVRRMTAALGFPTLRLIRYSIGSWTIKNLQFGQYQTLQINEQHY